MPSFLQTNAKIIFNSDKRDHLHEPNFGKVEAKKFVSNLKNTAVENPSMLPSQILKDVNMSNVPEEVAAHLPSTHNIKQTLLRAKAKELPANPRTIEDLELIPRIFSVTKDTGDFFLPYDSSNDEDDSDENCRILIFATENNLRKLFKSSVWFSDGTFKSAPGIFYQLFTIMGKFRWMHMGQEKTAVRPFVYALLENKAESTYRKVVETVIAEARKLQIPIIHPTTIITDFELAIINVFQKLFGDIVRACWFHLRQSVNRHIQGAGLQQTYRDPDDPSIRQAAHMMCALAFVPVEYVCEAFDLLKRHVPR